MKLCIIAVRVSRIDDVGLENGWIGSSQTDIETVAAAPFQI
jgi:hypothetical protein